ncbi:MAG: class I SAM-dependent methyltransferase [Methylococcaceae bacterium]
MRANPVKLREEFKKKLTEQEIIDLGVNLAAGADHYRAHVGPPFNYDINGGLQFQFMLDLGLREYHRFLEIGCGSLRLGRLLMTYLLPNRYYGVEPNKKILEEGMKYNLGSNDPNSPFFQLKNPSFAHNTEFDFSFVGKPVDYIVAQSIASHTGVTETEQLLKNISAVMHEDSIAMVTYIRCIAKVKNNTKDGWFYPECISYTDEHMGNVAKKLGLHAYRTYWPLLNRREDGLITSQTPLILTRKPWQPTFAQRLAGLETLEGDTVHKLA